VHSLAVSRVAIQGRIEYKRRDYTRVFDELLHALQGGFIDANFRLAHNGADWKLVLRPFSLLCDAATDDPAAWGYQTNDDGRFVETKHRTGGSITPFTLHLLGEHVGNVTWPDQLQDVIRVHSGLNYSEYYDVLSSMVRDSPPVHTPSRVVLTN
jgi:hypothetical protein